MRSSAWSELSRPWFGIAAAVVIAAMVGGCGNAGGGGGGGGDGTDGGGENVLLNESLGNEGALSGKILDTASTRDSLTDGSTAQAVPPEFDTENSCVRFHDLAGNELVDANGQPIGEVPIEPDGSFVADNLPVGVDFTICGDVGKNGDCEVESCVNIPSDDGGEEGRLDDVEADPLTTLVLAKLKRLLDERGIQPGDLEISPVAVVTRVVDAFNHLFEEAGIDQEITLDDLENAVGAQLAALFDTLVPAGARAGVDIVEGNLDLQRAVDLNDRALSIAKVFIRAGFPIADGPGDPDLSDLADIDAVEILSESDFFKDGDPFVEDFTEFDDELGDFLEPAAFGDGEFAATIYVNTLAEPDRNHAQAEDEGGDEDVGPHLPLLHDYLILQMARLQSENRRISLEDLYDLLVSIDDGLGARLTYFLFDPNFHGPPLNVFETEDGEGKAINLEGLFNRLFSDGFQDLRPDDFDRREAELRRLVNDLLNGTLKPRFGRLFDAVARDRVGSVEEFSETIRRVRAHLPFSRSGPSEFFVVADGDTFRGDDDASAITVDVDMDVDGDVLGVTYNPSGTGQFWLGFTRGTEERGFVDFIVRETGRFVHGRRGPVRLNMNNENIFEPINGQPFIDFVSENGTFYAGTHVSIIREEFTPEAFDPNDPFAGGPGEFFPPPGDGTLPPPGGDDPFNDDQNQPPPNDGQNGAPPDGDMPPPGDGQNDPPPGEDMLPPPDGEQPPGQDLPNGGPNQQIFVLATGIGEDAEPVRVDYNRDTGATVFNPGGRHLLMFLPDSDQTGLFALFNEKTGRAASNDDPEQFFEGLQERPDRFEDFFNNFDEFNDFGDVDDVGDFVDGLLLDIPPDELFRDPDFDEFFPPDGEFPPIDGEFPPPDGDLPPPGGDLPPPGEDMLPPPDGDMPPLDPAEFEDDGFEDTDGFDDIAPGDDFFHPEFDILVSVDEIIGLDLRLDNFNHVFGTSVPNERYDPSGDPYYDDINGNREHDVDEPTAQFRPLLFDPNDWRSTDIRLYYRRADNNASVLFENIDFGSETPQALDGVALVPRTYLPRLNAFRFGRPNTAINLLTAFLPPNFFDGTNSFNRESKVNVLTAIALINLVMDQVFNVEADIDVDGLGPLPKRNMLIDAHLFVVPVGDPFVLLLKGFRDRSIEFTGLE